MKYYCCSCKRFSRTKLKCSKCQSEDVFDTTKPEWPCGLCGADTALFRDFCECCKKAGRDVTTILLVTHLMRELFGIDVTDPYAPEEDFGDAAHKVFRGEFGKGQRLYGDAR
jgi:hypothetical protein